MSAALDILKFDPSLEDKSTLVKVVEQFQFLFEDIVVDEPTWRRIQVLFGVPPGPAKLTAALLKRERVSREQLFLATREGNDLFRDPDSLKAVQVYVSRMRKVLSPLGVNIVTVQSFGYELGAASKKRLREILEKGLDADA